MSVSSKAEGEASQKGLTGAAKRQYVGGAINRAKHEKAASATPAAKAKQQTHSYQREAVADARSQIRYHEAQITGLREGLKLRRELAGLSKKRSPTAKQLEERIRTTDLKPIRYVERREINLAQPPDPTFLREVYGQQQLAKALDLFPTTTLRESAKAHGMSAGGSREALIGRLAAASTPRAAPITRPLAQPKRAKAAKRKLVPVGRVDPAALDPYQPPNPHALRQLYGDEQLSEALDRYSLDALKKSAAAHGVDPKASSKRVLVDRLAAKAQGKEQPPKPKRAPRPKKPPTIEQQIERAGGYVPKTPADKLRKLPVREMTDAQLMRDWENHPPERRRGVLEREMARRQAKAEKAQQPKASAKPSAKPAAMAQGAKRGGDAGKLRETERELVARDAALERETADIWRRFHANDYPNDAEARSATHRAIYVNGPQRGKIARQLKSLRTRIARIEGK